MLTTDFKTLSTLTILVKSLSGEISADLYKSDKAFITLKTINHSNIFQLFISQSMFLVQVSPPEDAKELNDFLDSGCAYMCRMAALSQSSTDQAYNYQLTLNLFKHSLFGSVPLKLSFTEDAFEQFTGIIKPYGSLSYSSPEVREELSNFFLSYEAPELIQRTDQATVALPQDQLTPPTNYTEQFQRVFARARQNHEVFKNIGGQTWDLTMNKVQQSYYGSEIEGIEELCNFTSLVKSNLAATGVFAEYDDKSQAAENTAFQDSISSLILNRAQKSELSSVSGFWMMAFDQTTNTLSTWENPHIQSDQKFSLESNIQSYGSLSYISSISLLDQAQDDLAKHQALQLQKSSTHQSLINKIKARTQADQTWFNHAANLTEVKSGQAQVDLSEEEQYIADSPLAVFFHKTSLIDQTDYNYGFARSNAPTIKIETALNEPVAAEVAADAQAKAKANKAQTTASTPESQEPPELSSEPLLVTSFLKPVVTPTTLNFCDPNPAAFKPESQLGVVAYPMLPERCFLLGNGIQLTLVHLHQDPDLSHYYIVDCQRRYPHDLSFMPNVHLCQGKVAFYEATKLPSSIQQQLTEQQDNSKLNKLNRQHHGYLKLWYDYLILTWDMLISRAKKIGYLPIRGVRSNFSEYYILLHDPAPFELKVQDQIALVKEVPSYILDHKLNGKELIEKAYLDVNGRLIFAEDSARSESTASKGNKDRSTKSAAFSRQAALYGTVVSIKKHMLQVKFNQPNPHPEFFKFVVLSIYGQSVQLGRCLNAYWHIVNQNSANPQLGAILEGQRLWLNNQEDREHIAPLSERLKHKFASQMPDASQQQAMEIALNTPDIALIQGPPGTGKSTVICALIERLNELANKRQLGGAILISGYQHDTVNHLVSKIRVNTLPTLKFGQSNQDKKGWAKDQAAHFTPDASIQVDTNTEQIEQWIDSFKSDLSQNLQLDNLSATSVLEQKLNEYYSLPSASLALELLQELHNLSSSMGSWSTMAQADAFNPVQGLNQSPSQAQEHQLIGELMVKYRLLLNPPSKNQRGLIFSLRTDPISFFDDGVANAQKLRLELEPIPILSQQELALLAVTDPCTYNSTCYTPKVLTPETLEAIQEETISNFDENSYLDVAAHVPSTNAEKANFAAYLSHIADLRQKLIQAMQQAQLTRSYNLYDGELIKLCQHRLDQLKLMQGQHPEEKCKQIMFDFVQEVENNTDDIKRALADYGLVYAATVQQSEGEDIRRAKFNLFQQRVKRNTGILPDFSFLSLDDLTESNQRYLSSRQGANRQDTAVNQLLKQAQNVRTDLGISANTLEPARESEQARNSQLFNQILDQALTYDTVIIDEAARCNPLDLIIPLMRAKKRIILVGDQNQLPHVVDEEIAKALEQPHASLFHQQQGKKPKHGKAGRQGNAAQKGSTTKQNQQGLNELPQLDQQDAAQQNSEQQDSEQQSTELTVTGQLKQSLFSYLFATLNRQTEIDQIPRIITLNTQYRMHPLLGKFVSDNFYEGKLQSVKPANEFSHNLPELHDQFALWCDVPVETDNKPEIEPEINQGTSPARESKKKNLDLERKHGTSRVRDSEVEVIANYLKQWLADPACANLTFGVISFYKAQADAITQKLQSSDYLILDRQGRLTTPYQGQPKAQGQTRLSIGTVDSFQGKEFDVVILSMVRAQRLPSQVSNKFRRNDQLAAKLYGHLLATQRLCVALSRQQRCLMVVGAKDMIDHKFGQHYVPSLYNFLKLCTEHGKILSCHQTQDCAKGQTLKN